MRTETNEKADMMYQRIKSYHNIHGYMPSYRELMGLCNIGSTQEVHRTIMKLFRDGKLETDFRPIKSRAFRFGGRK